MQSIFTCRVYYEDTDAGGVVYHANYLRFMERARTEMLLSLHSEISAFVVYQVELEYIAPARLYTELEIITNIKEVRGTSIIFEQIVRSAKNINLIFCKGLVTVVCVNQDLKPCRIPQALREKITYDA